MQQLQQEPGLERRWEVLTDTMGMVWSHLRHLRHLRPEQGYMHLIRTTP